MAIVDTILFTKIGEQAVRVGDVGKTVIRDLPSDATIDDLEEFYFYTTDAPANEGYIGEINNIQVEPVLNKTPEEMEAGDAISYVAFDLLQDLVK